MVLDDLIADEDAAALCVHSRNNLSHNLDTSVIRPIVKDMAKMVDRSACVYEDWSDPMM